MKFRLSKFAVLICSLGLIAWLHWPLQEDVAAQGGAALQNPWGRVCDTDAFEPWPWSGANSGYGDFSPNIKSQPLRRSDDRLSDYGCSWRVRVDTSYTPYVTSYPLDSDGAYSVDTFFVGFYAKSESGQSESVVVLLPSYGYDVSGNTANHMLAYEIEINGTWSQYAFQVARQENQFSMVNMRIGIQPGSATVLVDDIFVGHEQKIHSTPTPSPSPTPSLTPTATPTATTCYPFEISYDWLSQTSEGWSTTSRTRIEVAPFNIDTGGQYKPGFSLADAGREYGHIQLDASELEDDLSSGQGGIGNIRVDYIEADIDYCNAPETKLNGPTCTNASDWHYDNVKVGYELSIFNAASYTEMWEGDVYQPLPTTLVLTRTSNTSEDINFIQVQAGYYRNQNMHFFVDNVIIRGCTQNPNDYPYSQATPTPTITPTATTTPAATLPPDGTAWPTPSGSSTPDIPTAQPTYTPQPTYTAIPFPTYAATPTGTPESITETIQGPGQFTGEPPVPAADWYFAIIEYPTMCSYLIPENPVVPYIRICWKYFSIRAIAAGIRIPVTTVIAALSLFAVWRVYVKTQA